MRRPVFNRWIKQECSRIAERDRFSLPQFVALAQSYRENPSDTVDRKRLTAALHLHAIANGCLPRLHEYVWKESLEEHYRRVENALGARDIQRLALRGTPLMSLPQEYRDVLQSFYEAYYAPELLAQQKRSLHEKARLLQLKSGTTSTEIANACGIALPNVVAYLKNAAVEKVSLDSAQAILSYLESIVPSER